MIKTSMSSLGWGPAQPETGGLSQYPQYAHQGKPSIPRDATVIHTKIVDHSYTSIHLDNLLGRKADHTRRDLTKTSPKK